MRGCVVAWEELASLAPHDEFFSVAQSSGTIEILSEGFAYQRTRGHVVATNTLVDLLQDVLAFFLGMHFMSTPEVVPCL
jgi:hypothetical protein